MDHTDVDGAPVVPLALPDHDDTQQEDVQFFWYQFVDWQPEDLLPPACDAERRLLGRLQRPLAGGEIARVPPSPYAGRERIRQLFLQKQPPGVPDPPDHEQSRVDLYLSAGEALGEVYVAVKQLPFAHILQARARRAGGGENFLFELGVLRLLARNPHPNLQVLHGVYRTDNFIHIETGFGGRDLSTVVMAEGGMPRDTLCQVLRQILFAFRHLDELSVGHADFSLENATAHELQGGLHVTVIDFGFAKVSRSADGKLLWYLTAPTGKNQYLPPETPFGWNWHGDRMRRVRRPAGDTGDIRFVKDARAGHVFEVVLPEGATGDDVDAQFAGYAVLPFDMWTIGICMAVLHFGRYMWKTNSLWQTRPEDQYFLRFLHRGIRYVVDLLGRHWPPMDADLVGFLELFLQADPKDRTTPAAALAALDTLEAAAAAAAPAEGAAAAAAAATAPATPAAPAQAAGAAAASSVAPAAAAAAATASAPAAGAAAGSSAAAAAATSPKGGGRQRR